MKRVFGGWKVTLVALGVAMAFFASGTGTATPVSGIQGELSRITREIAQTEEILANLALRAAAAPDLGSVLEMERRNYEAEKKLHELAGALLEQEGMFLEAKPEILERAAEGEAKWITILIGTEELIAKAKAALAAAWGRSAKVEENLVARKKKLIALPMGAEGCCVRFDALPAGTSFHVGDSFTDCARMKTERFQWSTGAWTTSGRATVVPAGRAGGSGRELNLNNVNLVIDFGRPLKGLVIRFGEYGGNLNMMVNGMSKNFANFQDIKGTWGGLQVMVTGGYGNDKGVLEIRGEIVEFSLGGQELYLDDICPLY